MQTETLVSGGCPGGEGRSARKSPRTSSRVNGTCGGSRSRRRAADDARETAQLPVSLGNPEETLQLGQEGNWGLRLEPLLTERGGLMPGELRSRVGCVERWECDGPWGGGADEGPRR